MYGAYSLSKQYGNERLENACAYALTVGAYSRNRLLAILKNNLDKIPLTKYVDTPIIQHQNIRGASVYK